MAYHTSTIKNKKITWHSRTLGSMPGENRSSGNYWVVSTRRKIKLVAMALIPAVAMGCSVTSLQCGVDGDSSFVNLNTTPAQFSQTARTMAELCSFNYQE